MVVNISVHMHRQGICAYLLHTINKHTSTYIAKELKMVLFVYIFFFLKNAKKKKWQGQDLRSPGWPPSHSSPGWP